MSSPFDKIEAIFEAAVALETEAQRADYLSRSCPDPELRREVESLLASHETPDRIFLEEAPTMASPAPESVGTLVGRYKLLEQIGEGGCGVVYVAEQTEPVRRRVALKVIKLGMDTRAVVARFEAERQALAMMDHPNIAKVLDAGATENGFSLDQESPAQDAPESKVEGVALRQPGLSQRDRPCHGPHHRAHPGEGRLSARSWNGIGAGRPYFVMELVRGVPITEYCDNNRLSTQERLELFIPVCHAIQHAHQKGIIHRDIKPSNILVTLHDGVPVPKVIDFGIAKATEGRLTDATVYTQLHQFIGTPAYMSPEQAEMSGLDIDTRSDIYSLGVLLYELLVGAPPFDGKELVSMGIEAMRKTIRQTEPVRPSTRLSKTLAGAGVRRLKSGSTDTRGSEEDVRASSRRLLRLKETISQLQGDLDWIVMKCLEKDRARRYETANGLAADIERHLQCEPVTARPPSAAYRFRKTLRRNKLVFMAAAAVAAALMIGAAVSTWQAIRATRAEREQNSLREVAVQALESETAQRKIAEIEHERADAQALKAVENQRRSQRLLYAADMNLAQQSFKQNNLGRARSLLDRHRPQPGEEDLRGWEWRYLWQLTRSSALVTLTNKPTMGFSVSFSPDGKHLAAGWAEGSGNPQVDLWDVPSRRLVRSWEDRGNPSPGHPNYQGRAVFSPVRNLLAATTAYKTLSLYDLDSGRESILWQAPEEGWWSVRDLSFSRDGSKLAIYAGSSPNRGAAVWVVHVSSGKIQKRYPTVCPISWWLGAAQLSPDGQRLYLSRSEPSNNGYRIQCLDLESDRELWQTELQTDDALGTLAVSPDGRVLASGSGYGDRSIRLWEASTGRFVRQLEGHNARICGLAFSEDGRHLTSASADQTLRIWDTDTWTETRVRFGHNAPVFDVAISQSAGLVASAAMNGDLMLWNTDEQNRASGYIGLPKGTGNDRFVPLDHSRVLLLPQDHSPQIIDLKRNSAPVPLPELGPSTHVLDYSGSNLLFTWNGTNQILVRELQGADFVLLGEITVEPGRRPGAFAYNPASQLLAWTESSSPNSVYLATLTAPGRRIELKSNAGEVVSMFFSEDRNHLAARTLDGKTQGARVWNVETGQIVVSVNEWITAATFAAGGRALFMSLQAGNDTLFFDLNHPNPPPRRLKGKYPCWTLAVTPDGRLVAGNTLGGEVRLWDAATGDLVDSIHGHKSAVNSSAFSPDGQRMISTSGTAKETVRLWDVGTRQELLTLDGVAGRGYWTADGDVILVGGPQPDAGGILAGEGLQAWAAPSWEEITAAEAQNNAEDRQP
jgi:eukaryotic-like serine/threonine-protein kinase